MISKRIFGHILLAILLSPLNQIKAQENSCITTFSKEIPNGLIASTAELEALSNEFKEYLKSSDLEVEQFNCDEDKKFKINSELSKIINKEIVLHNYSSSTNSCRLKFNKKDKMIEARNLRQTNAFINELSSINASKITERSRYNAELRDFVLKNQRYIENDCTNQYIFLFTAANNFAKTRQCSVGERYLAAAASILKKSKIVSDKEEGRLNNIRNSLDSCSPIIEPKQPVKIEPKQPIGSEQEPSKGPENINDEPFPNSSSFRIQILQNQIKILQETVANLEGKLELNDLEIKRLDNIANEAIKNNENLIKEKEQIAISYAEKVSELESDIFDLQIQVAEKNSEIEGLNDDIGGLNDQIGELKEENIKLKKQLRDESIFGPIMQIFKLKNLWYLLLIPFLLIGLILYNRTQEEKALEIEKKHFFTTEKPSEAFLRLWDELSGRKLLEKSLNKHHLYKQPRKKTYFFIKGFTKYFMDLHMDDDKELAINLKHIITEIFNIDVAYSLSKYNLDSDMDSINYFNKGISKAKDVFDL